MNTCEIENYEMETPLEELFNEAIMSETPLIIVEGIDDISVYEKIVNNSSIDNAQVMAIENIRDYDAGCDNIINAITYLQDMIVEKEENKKYILGIIDRDARFYRGDIPQLQGLFILKYYSYESHFVGDEGIKYILPLVTNCYDQMIDERVINVLQKDLNNKYYDLYYISLEALKNACVVDYHGIVGYSQKAGSVFSRDCKDLILRQLNKQALDSFASEKNINFSDLKSIAKGKWLIHVYAETILANLQNAKVKIRM